MRKTLIIVAIVLVVLGAAAYALLAGPWAAESVRSRLVTEATKSLGREITVTRLSGDPIRGVVLEGVRIADPPGTPPGTFFEAPRVIVHYDPGKLLTDLLTSRGVTKSILFIEVERPFLVLARDVRGRWNYTDLLAPRPGQPMSPAFTAKVIVREGSLVFSDALDLRAGPFAAHFDRITGTVDFAHSPRIDVSADAVNTDGATPALLHVTGQATLGEEKFDLDIAARGGSNAYWGPYLLRLPWLAWRGGTFDGVMHLLASRWGHSVVLDYRGRLLLRNGQALLLPQRTTLSEINGPLVVDNVGISTDGATMVVSGALPGVRAPASPVWVRGTITHVAGVHLDLAIRSPSLDLATLQRLIFPQTGVRVAGRAGGDARIVGSLGALRVDGRIASASGRVNNQGFAGLAGTFQYYGGLLVFDRMTVQAGGGQIRGHLRLSTADGSFFAQADARSVDTLILPGLGITIDRSLRGSATGFVAAAGAPGNVLVYGRLRVDRGSIFGIGFDQLETVFGYRRGAVEVDRLFARSGTSTMHAYGEVKRGGEMALALAGHDVNLVSVGERFGLGQWLAGRADVTGSLVGSLRQPVLSGDIWARGGRLGPFPFDSAAGDIQVRSTGVSSSGLTLHDGRGTYRAEGGIRWDGKGQVDLTVRADNVPAERLLAIADVPVDLHGTLRGTLTVSGPLRRPQAAGTVELREGRVEGQRVDRAQAEFRWTGTDLLLDRATASVNSSIVEARGSVSRRGALGISFSAQDLNARDIGALRSDVIQVAGRVDLTGTISGTLAAPVVNTAVSSKSLVLNGQRFDQAAGTVAYRRGRFFLNPLVLRQGDGTFQLSGNLDLRDDPVLQVQVQARRARLSTLLGLARVRPPFALDGLLDGDLTAAGAFSNLSATLVARLTSGTIGDHPVREAAVDAALANHAVTLRSLQIAADRGDLIGAGRIDLRGDSEVEFAGRGLSLDLLRPMLGISRPLSGTLDFTLQLTGRLTDPQVGLSASVTNGAIGSTAFDQFVLQAYYRDGQFQIEQGLLQEGRHKAQLEGSVPFNPARLRFDDSRPMNLHLQLVDADLSLLGLLTDQVERAEGPLLGEVALTGTVGRPKMDGSLSVADGVIKLRGIDPAFTSVRGQVTFDQDEIRVGTVTARAGEGTVTLTGTVGISSFRPDRLNLQLVADGARVKYAPAFAGRIDGTLKLEGTAVRPVISGGLTLSGGDLAVTSTRTATGPVEGLNPILDVDLRSGQELWVNVGALRFLVHGTVHAAGSWRGPKLAGEVTAERGTFIAFNNSFMLTEGQATFSEFRGLVPFVEAHGQTQVPARIGDRIETVTVFLTVQGTPDNLMLLLSSDPPLPREQILSALARQAGVAQLLEGDLEGALRAELSNALFGPFNRALAQALGLEEFRIAFDFERPLQLRIGKLLVSNLYVTLTSEFGSTPRHVWALEYRFSPNTRLTLSIDNTGRVDFLYLVTYRF